MPSTVIDRPATSANLSAAEAVWFATAALHKQHPEAKGFTIEQIVAEAMRQHLSDVKENTLYQHALQHVVSNRPAQPNRRRMLVEIENDLRRLFVPGDPEHPDRRNSLTLPDFAAMPEGLRQWQGWYEQWSSKHAKSWEETDPIMRLIGIGKGIWANEDPVEYVRHLREGWD